MNNKTIVRLLIVFIAIIIYEIAARLEWIDPFTFIPFTKMVQEMFSILFDKQFFQEHLLVTFLEIIISFASAVVFGFILGLILWRSKTTYYIVQPYLMLFYATPFFALYPIFISIFGIGYLPVVILGTLFAMPAVISNTAIGFLEVKDVYIKVGKSFNMPLRKMITHIYLPAAWPYIFTGLKLASTYSVIAVIATEFILSARGIGYSISYAYDNFDLEGMYGAILLVVSISLTVNLTLNYIESRLYAKA